LKTDIDFPKLFLLQILRRKMLSRQRLEIISHFVGQRRDLAIYIYIYIYIRPTIYSNYDIINDDVKLLDLWYTQFCRRVIREIIVD